MENTKLKITVVFLGPFGGHVKNRMVELEIDSGSSVGDLADLMADEYFRDMPRFRGEAVAARHGSKVSRDAALADGDRIIFLSPVVGGG